VNLGRFAQRIFRDFELELAFANQLEGRRERLGHVVKAAFEIETTESDVLLDHHWNSLKGKRIAHV
jgi:hypothetical protein